MNPIPPPPTTWPDTVNGRQWSSHGFASRHPDVYPVLRQAPGVVPLPPIAVFPQGPQAPIFTYTQPTDGYAPHPTRSNENFFQVPPRVVPSVNSFDQDAHRRRREPIRRPAHWEDDPYSSTHDSGFHAYGPRCCSAAYYDCNYHGSCRSGCPNHWRPSSEIYQGSHHLQHTCPHWSYHNPSARRCSTLTYIGPPTEHSCPSCGSPAAQPTAPLPSRQEEYSHPKFDGKENRSKGKGEKKRSWRGAVGCWLDKHLPFTTKLAPLKRPNQTQADKEPEVAPQPLDNSRSIVNPSGIRHVSPSSADTSAAIASRLHASELSPTVETVADSPSSEDHRHLGLNSHSPPPQPIPARPPSTISTCQCLPLNKFTLHQTLQHSYHAQPTINWDVTVSPTVIPPLDFESNFLDEPATSPPIRHLFINGIADFPLERCLGDPDPQRIKNHSQHLYPTDVPGPNELIEKRTLPWPIRITGSGEHGYITVGDVLRAIRHNFEQYIPQDEYDRYTIQRKRLMAAAYHLRQKVLEEKRSWPHGTGFVRPEYHEDRIEEGIMRCDYLGSQLMFRGLEVSPDEEGYTLFLGPAN